MRIIDLLPTRPARIAQDWVVPAGEWELHGLMFTLITTATAGARYPQLLYSRPPIYSAHLLWESDNTLAASGQAYFLAGHGVERISIVSAYRTSMGRFHVAGDGVLSLTIVNADAPSGDSVTGAVLQLRDCLCTCGGER